MPKQRKWRPVIHHKPQLTDDQIIFIREHRGIVTQAKLGEMFGRHQASINAIQHHWTYRHLKPTAIETAYYNDVILPAYRAALAKKEPTNV